MMSEMGNGERGKGKDGFCNTVVYMVWKVYPLLQLFSAFRPSILFAVFVAKFAFGWCVGGGRSFVYICLCCTISVHRQGFGQKSTIFSPLLYGYPSIRSKSGHSRTPLLQYHFHELFYVAVLIRSDPTIVSNTPSFFAASSALSTHSPSTVQNLSTSSPLGIRTPLCPFSTGLTIVRPI